MTAMPDDKPASSVTRREMVEDFHGSLRELRTAAPAVWISELDGWVVTRYDAVVDILRDPVRFTVEDDRFSTGRVVGPSMLSTDGDRHRTHRKPFEPMFRAKPVADSRANVVDAIDALVEALDRQSSFDIRIDFAAPLAVKVICDFLGLTEPSMRPGSQVELSLLTAYRQIVAAVANLRADSPVPDDAREAVEDLNRLILAQRPEIVRQAPVGASASTLSEAQRLSNLAVILFGAIETSEAMTANAVYHLQQWSWEDALQRAAQENPADTARFCRAAVTESLRLEPAAAVVDRYATIDLEVGESRISAGDLVIVSLAGANRDPEVFDDPDRFDPDRANSSKQLAFARGPHACLGIHLANTQTILAIERLLNRFPGMRIDWNRSSEPSGLVFRKPERLLAYH